MRFHLLGPNWSKSSKVSAFSAICGLAWLGFEKEALAALAWPKDKSQRQASCPRRAKLTQRWKADHSSFTALHLDVCSFAAIDSKCRGSLGKSQASFNTIQNLHWANLTLLSKETPRVFEATSSWLFKHMGSVSPNKERKKEFGHPILPIVLQKGKAGSFFHWSG